MVPFSLYPMDSSEDNVQSVLLDHAIELVTANDDFTGHSVGLDIMKISGMSSITAAAPALTLPPLPARLPYWRAARRLCWAAYTPTPALLNPTHHHTCNCKCQGWF